MSRLNNQNRTSRIFSRVHASRLSPCCARLLALHTGTSHAQLSKTVPSQFQIDNYIQNAWFRVMSCSTRRSDKSQVSVVTERSRLGGFLGRGGVPGDRKRRRKPIDASQMRVLI
jgi:hypothetical protein